MEWLIILGLLALANKHKNKVVDDVVIDTDPDIDTDIDTDTEPDTDTDVDVDSEDITEIEENTINGTARQVVSYYGTQKKIKNLKGRADKLKQHTSDLMLKVKDNNNLTPEEKGFLRNQIVNTVDLKSAFVKR